MNSKVILDASALLTVFNEEIGQEKVLPVLRNSLISTVNLCEVASHILQKQWPLHLVIDPIDELGIKVIAFDLEQMKMAAQFITVTKPYGLSLGDRACLALASLYPDAIVYTADQIWKKLSLPFDICLIR